MPDVSKCMRYTEAARQCGLTEGCLRKAMDRGSITFYLTACGNRMVQLKDVRAYAKKTFGGRPRLTT